MKSKLDAVHMEKQKLQQLEISYNVLAIMINTRNSYKNVQRYTQMINRVITF